MLRRKSEFFDFVDNLRSSKSQSAEQESQLSPFEDYLQMLLDMKIASSVSSRKEKHNLIESKGAMCKM